MSSGPRRYHSKLRGTLCIGTCGPRKVECQVLFLACFVLLASSLCTTLSLLAIDLRPVAPWFRVLVSVPTHTTGTTTSSVSCLSPSRNQ